jgi:predicted transposase YdaD
MLTAVSGDDRFKEIAMMTKDKAGTQEGKGVVTMRSQFIDNIWKRAKAEGEKIGERRGEKRGELRGELRGEAKGDHRATIRVLRRSIDNMLKKTNYTRDEILDILEVSPEELKQLELTQN